MIEEKDLFILIKKYIDKYNQSKLQIDSYNYFINFGIKSIFENNSKIVIDCNLFDYIVEFSNVMIDKPYIIDDNRKIRYITPNECRIRNLSYDSVISINIDEYKVDKNGQILEHKIHNKIQFFEEKN